jgi:hypothetical protein
MSVLIDRHHSDLFRSMQALFEDRLGLEVYTPIGREWWDAGYWRFGEGYGDDRLVRQFLEGSTDDQHHPDRPIRGVDLATARTMTWSHVVATVEDNQAGFRRFADEHGAKYVVQVGNTRQFIDHSLDPIILDLAQEFDHTGTFRFREPVRQDRVTSFVNLLPLIPEAWAGFEGLRARLPYDFRSFGHACPDGFRDPVSAVADEMAEAGWAYHDKVTGDGFGHVIHDWAAVGRPLIGHASYYEGQRAEVFWIDGVTCIDLDRHSLDEAAAIIQNTTPAQHREMCLAIRRVLDEVYDPDADEETARRLLL